MTDRSDRTRWAAVLSLMTAGVVAAAQIGKGAAALPVLADDFGLSAAAGAWFLSVMSALGAVLGAVLGWTGQAVGFRRQVQAGLGVLLVAQLAGAAVDSTAWLLADRVLEGLGFVLVVLAAPGLLPAVSAPGQRRLVVGAWGAYMPVGSGLAALLVPVGIAGLGWRTTWLLDALAAALALVAIGLCVPGDTAGARPRADGLVRALRTPGVLCLAGVFGVYAGQYLAVVGLFPGVLVDDGGLSATAAGVVTGIVFLVNAPGNVLGAWLQHRGVARWRLVVVGSLAMGVTVWAVLDPALPLAARITAAVLFSAVSGLVPSAAFSGVATMTAGTGAAGASVGLLMQGSGIGQLLVPPLVVATGGAAAGWTAPPAVLCALAALGVLGGVAYRSWERPPAAVPLPERSAPRSR
ncbi:MFS transporter [Modestobacter sp. NPDC049651]|uniref:MFS transporter n=1 Tax=unclassified Modestobacter TaxID=2643866 RepID=UPI0033EA648A